MALSKLSSNNGHWPPPTHKQDNVVDNIGEGECVAKNGTPRNQGCPGASIKAILQVCALVDDSVKCILTPPASSQSGARHH